MSWRPPAHNAEGQEGLWYRSVCQSHGAFCGCGDFVGHLNRLAERLGRPQPPRPPGGPPGPAIRVLPALPPAEGSPRRHNRTENQPCGGGDADFGDQRDAGDGGAAADDLSPADVEDLLDWLDAPESKTPKNRGPRGRCRRRLTFQGEKTPSLARLDLGRNRERSRSPRREDATGAAPTAAQRATTAQMRNPVHVPAINKNAASPPRPSYPSISPKALLFPERLPQMWTKQDWETEQQAAAVWDRPMRNNLTDPPFYPWMPRYRVSLRLGFNPQ
ncbi:ORF4 [Torque teno virus 6]|uniref:ORF4 n=2 Tax=Torque teno virus (isolate Human/Germany/KAV/2001) TaxID=687345 RepID=UPI00000EE7F1|nr:ORF4 [Torque teno virus 6]AAL28137.1 ORF4 [Torque teno virus 6]